VIVDRILERAQELGRERRNKARLGAYNAGQCVLKNWFQLHNAEAEALPARSLLVFDLGNRVEDAINDWLRKADIPNIRAEKQDSVQLLDLTFGPCPDCEGSGRDGWGDQCDHCKGSGKQGGWIRPDFVVEVEESWLDNIARHAIDPDSDLRASNVPADELPPQPGELMVVEVKSMSDFAFERACRGILDDSYLAQCESYCRGYGYRHTCLLGYRKETSHLCEILVQRSDTRWEKICANAEKARADKMPPRPYELEVACEGCKGTGLTPKRQQPHKACGGSGNIPGGPYIPNFPCGYCGYKQPCWGKLELTFFQGKPRWRVV
jgi:hypothetical protein